MVRLSARAGTGVSPGLLTVLLQSLPELTTQRGQREKGERRQQNKRAGPRLDLEVM